jgi:HK97 gp10 family phage protein
MKIKLRGLAELQKKLTDWEDSRVKEVRKFLQKTGKAVRRDARRRAPKNTGRLRKGISYAFKQRKKKGMGVYIRAVAPYSHIVELGSVVRNIPPRPFMTPAFDAAKGDCMAGLENIMGKV